MATFIYNGEDEREFPSISTIVKGGDSFEAPDDFTAPNVSLKPTKAKSAPTVGDE
jgi:hypothetical protein